MASQWFYQVLGAEFGPVSFRQLAELAGSGRLKEGDLVRRAETPSWSRADSVVGLFREPPEPADDAPQQPRPVENQPPGASPPHSPANRQRTGSRRKRLIVVGSLAGILVSAVVMLSQWDRRPRFPEPKLPAAQAKAGDPSVILPPPPAAPTIPGLKKLEATPIPGLEEIESAFSPSLSEDLRVIVFSAPGGPGKRLDLFAAERDDPTRPFGQPRLVAACSSNDVDARPSLSPDGLRVVFVRSDKNPQVLYSDRSSISEEFGEPVPVTLGGFPNKGQQVAFAQLIGRDELIVRTKDLATDERAVHQFRAAGSSAAFASPRPVPVANAWVMHYVAPSMVRTYFGTADGLFVSGRRDLKQPFSPDIKLVDASISGPIDGPIWVAPREDMIFYCSAGPGNPMGSARKLWMIAF